MLSASGGHIPSVLQERRGESGQYAQVVMHIHRPVARNAPDFGEAA